MNAPISKKRRLNRVPQNREKGSSAKGPRGNASDDLESDICDITALSEEVFSEDWNSDEDAIYDAV